MSDYLEFVDKYAGQGIDFDGSFLWQSPDLAAQYVEHMTGDHDRAAQSRQRNAIDWADPGLCIDLDGVAEYHDEGVPAPGDLVVTRYDTPFGSIGVLTEAVTRRGVYSLFTQNPGPAGVRKFKTKHNPIVGWWRFR